MLKYRKPSLFIKLLRQINGGEKEFHTDGHITKDNECNRVEGKSSTKHLNGKL